MATMVAIEPIALSASAARKPPTLADQGEPSRFVIGANLPPRRARSPGRFGPSSIIGRAYRGPMADRIPRSQFAATFDLPDWRIVLHAIEGWFSAPSFDAGAAF